MKKTPFPHKTINSFVLDVLHRDHKWHPFSVFALCSSREWDFLLVPLQPFKAVRLFDDW